MCLLPVACDHRITLSALANTFGGIVRPICLAVFRLITNSNFVGCSTRRGRAGSLGSGSSHQPTARTCAVTRLRQASNSKRETGECRLAPISPDGVDSAPSGVRSLPRRGLKDC